MNSNAQPNIQPGLRKSAEPVNFTLGFTGPQLVLHPTQFHVNEAWIAFKLNDASISAGADGDLNFIVLMDAASCFILSTALVSATDAEPSRKEAKRLLKEAQAHKQQLPEKLFIPIDQPANLLSMEAERQGINVVRIAEDQLLAFTSEARESFMERFGGGRTQ